MKRTPQTYPCGVCGRRLKSKLTSPDAEGKGGGVQVGWIRSSHTGARYCYPGEGCDKTNSKRALR